jgi:hypothetical protein
LPGLLLAAWLPHLLPSAPADDAAAGLRDAASKGQTAQVKTFLEQGAAVDGADRNGRTALMLAAQQGRADAVRMLLSKGANAGARDKSGYTAWDLAMFSPSGHRSHESALKALPQPPRIRVVVNAGWTPVHLISSCFMPAGELRNGIDKTDLDHTILDQFETFAVKSGKNLIEIVHATPRGMNTVLTADGVAPVEAADAQAVVNLQVQPGAGCSAGKDSLSLEIDVRVFRTRDRGLLLGKTFGGGIKGLRTIPVDNPTQYLPVYLNWIKPEAEPIYWGVAEALYRSEL